MKDERFDMDIEQDNDFTEVESSKREDVDQFIGRYRQRKGTMPPIAKKKGIDKKYIKIGGGIIAVIIIIFLILKGCSGGEEETVDETTTEETTVVEETTTAAEEAVLTPEEKDSKVQVLIENYYKAAFVNCDMKALALCIDSMDNITEESFTIQNKYIESCDDISCYKVDTEDENIFIVYVDVDYKLFNIETKVPSLDRFVVIKDDKDNYLVHNLTKGDEVDTYINGDYDTELVDKLYKTVQSQLKKALESDEDLKNIYNILMNSESN